MYEFEKTSLSLYSNDIDEFPKIIIYKTINCEQKLLYIKFNRQKWHIFLGTI